MIKVLKDMVCYQRQEWRGQSRQSCYHQHTCSDHEVLQILQPWWEGSHQNSSEAWIRQNNTSTEEELRQHTLASLHKNKHIFLFLLHHGEPEPGELPHIELQEQSVASWCRQVNNRWKNDSVTRLAPVLYTENGEN